MHFKNIIIPPFFVFNYLAYLSVSTFQYQCFYLFPHNITFVILYFEIQITNNIDNNIHNF